MNQKRHRLSKSKKITSGNEAKVLRLTKKCDKIKQQKLKGIRK